MQIMRALALGLLLTLSSASAFGAAPKTVEPPAERTLTLDAAIRIARTHHPTIEATRAQLEAARARLAQARAQFLPGLTGYFSYQPQTANIALTPAFKRVLVAGPTSGMQAMQQFPPDYQLFNYYTAGVGLSWSAFDWGHRLYGVRAARAQVSSQTLTERASEADVTLNVELAYYGVLAAQAALEVAKEAVTSETLHLDQARAFFEVGSKTQIDVASAESDLAGAKLTLARAHGALDSTRAQLSSALGEDHWQDYTLTVPAPAPVDRDASADAKTLMDEALKARPEPRAFLFSAQGLADQARSLRGSYLPALTFTVGPDWAGTEINRLVTNVTLNLTLSFPLLGMNPLAVHEQVREAKANAQAALAGMRGAANQVRLETAQARAGLTSALEAVKAAAELERASRARRDLAFGRYRAGVGSILELSDAQLNYVSARFQVVQANLSLWQARAELDHALGRM